VDAATMLWSLLRAGATWTRHLRRMHGRAFPRACLEC